MNVPQVAGFVVSSRLATLHELQSVYGLEGMYDLVEIAQVDRHNEAVAQSEQNGG